MTKPTFIYIASPYTKGDVAVNVRTSIDAADILLLKGYNVFAPLFTHFWHMIHPHPWDIWLNHDMAWIKKCDAVLRLPGESKGADAEVTLAQTLGKPVYYSIEELLNAKT